MKLLLKKIFIVVLLVVVWKSLFAQTPNPIVQRLDMREIEDNKTSAAIAYNFVNAIMQKDFTGMIQYLDLSPRQ